MRDIAPPEESRVFGVSPKELNLVREEPETDKGRSFFTFALSGTFVQERRIPAEPCPEP